MDAEDLKTLAVIKLSLARIEARQILFGGKLNTMSDQEKQLNDTITSLRETTVQGFNDLGDNVQKATQRVIQRLEKNEDADLSEEIGLLQELQSTMRDSTKKIADDLGNIAPPDESGDSSAIGETGPSSVATSSGELVTDVDSTRDQMRTPVRQSTEVFTTPDGTIDSPAANIEGAADSISEANNQAQTDATPKGNAPVIETATGTSATVKTDGESS